jgi:hypothetical protein
MVVQPFLSNSHAEDEIVQTLIRSEFPSQCVEQALPNLSVLREEQCCEFDMLRSAAIARNY